MVFSKKRGALRYAIVCPTDTVRAELEEALKAWSEDLLWDNNGSGMWWMTYLRSSVPMFQQASSKLAYGHLSRNAAFNLALVQTGRTR
jgi:hypothetical protein